MTHMDGRGCCHDLYRVNEIAKNRITLGKHATGGFRMEGEKGYGDLGKRVSCEFDGLGILSFSDPSIWKLVFSSF